jgi:hypothetical protein
MEENEDENVTACFSRRVGEGDKDEEDADDAFFFRIGLGWMGE